VGADGVGSVVRRTAGLGEAGLRARVVEIDTPGCGADGPRDMLHFEASDRALTGYSWDFPTLVEGRALMCRGAYVLPMGRGARDPREALEAHLRARGLSLEGVRQKRFAERAWAGPAKLSAPRRLLVGEAAGVDPITGEGIPQAIASGILAGRYLGECFERGELGFGDWTARVRRAGFARDLAVRLALVPRFFGAERPWIERFLVGRPWFLRSGIEYFAGRRVPRMVLARAALWGLGLWVRYRLGLG
jgi:flavin-dependent dehydrogenase